MRSVLFMLFIFFCKPLFAQIILTSPADAKKYPNLDLQNIRWANYQQLHYNVSDFDKAFLESNFYELKDYALAEKVLFQKINHYRRQMGLKGLEWNQVGADVSREHAKECSALGYIVHELNGRSPTDRMQPEFDHKIKVLENLHHFGGTVIPESVDSYTDYILSCWINSRGHNQNLLNRGSVACAAIFCKKDIGQNEHSTVSVFSIIHKR